MMYFSLIETEPERVTSITTKDPPQTPLRMQLYTSPDFHAPLDPNAKVQCDKRIYAEVKACPVFSLYLMPLSLYHMPLFI